MDQQKKVFLNNRTENIEIFKIVLKQALILAYMGSIWVHSFKYSITNIAAEITFFADRGFRFSHLLNTTCNFLRRHVYYPVRRIGINRLVCYSIGILFAYTVIELMLFQMMGTMNVKQYMMMLVSIAIFCI